MAASAASRDLGMGARIGCENQSGVEHDAYTIAHGCFSSFNRDHNNRVCVIDIVSDLRFYPRTGVYLSKIEI
jgi:hypothetical protein